MTSGAFSLPQDQTSDSRGTMEHFATIARIAEEQAGLMLLPEKAPMVFSRLAKRMRALGISQIADYCSLLRGPEANAEMPGFISALTTNVTSFFRERHHFDTLREEVLPELVARARRGDRIRLWSAGCSTGQEPYSIAMLLLEACADIARLDVRILATDIDQNVLEAARQGIYAEAEVETIPVDLRRKYLLGPKQSSDSGFARVGDPLKTLVTFRHLNLIRPWPFKGPFDVIFCRNVIIYFGPSVQRDLWKKFALVCARDGLLFLGHSERLEHPEELGFISAGTTTYRKNASQN